MRQKNSKRTRAQIHDKPAKAAVKAAQPGIYEHALSYVPKNDKLKERALSIMLHQLILKPAL